MKTLLILVLLFLATLSGYSQSPKEVYHLKNDVTVDNILNRFDTSNDLCGSDSYSVGSEAQIIIARIYDITTYIVVLSKNNKGTNMATPGKYYCISKASLDNYFEKYGSPDYGILTVPFKLRIDPIKVMAGNTVGPFIGKRYLHQNGTSSTLLCFASLTNVPLNDLNEDVPETKWGVGLGCGYVWTIADNFQAGVISGIDLFEGVETWPYKFQPWLSLSIGFSFTSTKKEEELILLAE